MVRKDLPLELKKLKELMSVMNRAGMKRLLLQDGEFTLELERRDTPTKGTKGEASPLPIPQEERGVRHSDIPTSLHPPVDSGTVSKGEDRFQYITSPMVGTFYASPSPDHAPFVKVGSVVDEGMVVCIIEAMKVMNEVKGGKRGTVQEVLVEDGHPVEFGTKLFRIS